MLQKKTDIFTQKYKNEVQGIRQGAHYINFPNGTT